MIDPRDTRDILGLCISQLKLTIPRSKGTEYSGCDDMDKPRTNLCELSLDGPQATIVLNRVEAYNTLNIELISEITTLLDWTSDHSLTKGGFLRVLHLCAEGRHFCAGADVNMMRDAGSKSEEENRRDSSDLTACSIVSGHTPASLSVGYKALLLVEGAGLVACLDHVIAEPNTKIALSEVKLGILPAVIGPYVYKRLGSANFRRLSMLAGKMNSNEALRVGFIDQLVDSESSLATASVEVAERF